MYVISIETSRAILLIIKRQKNNEWVIGSGVWIFVAGILHEFVLVLINKEFYDKYIILILIFSLSHKNNNCEIQLVKIQTLSDQNLLKEKERQQILANQNELLEYQVMKEFSN